jgi:hypothetical protein
MHVLITYGVKNKDTGKPFYLSPERPESVENMAKEIERRTSRLQYNYSLIKNFPFKMWLEKIML